MQWQKLVLGIVLVPIICASLTFAVAKTLHEKVHADASTSSHQCAVTLLAQQLIVANEPAPITIEISEGLVVLTVPCKSVAFPVQDFGDASPRAPPLNPRLLICVG